MICDSQARYFHHWAMIIFNQIVRSIQILNAVFWRSVYLIYWGTIRTGQHRLLFKLARLHFSLPVRLVLNLVTNIMIEITQFKKNDLFTIYDLKSNGKTNKGFRLELGFIIWHIAYFPWQHFDLHTLSF